MTHSILPTLPDFEPVSRLLSRYGTPFLSGGSRCTTTFCSWFLDVLMFDSQWWIVLGLLGFGSVAAGVFVSAPWAHRPDDDGTRV